MFGKWGGTKELRRRNVVWVTLRRADRVETRRDPASPSGARTRRLADTRGDGAKRRLRARRKDPAAKRGGFEPEAETNEVQARRQAYETRRTPEICEAKAGGRAGRNGDFLKKFAEVSEPRVEDKRLRSGKIKNITPTFSWSRNPLYFPFR